MVVRKIGGLVRSLALGLDLDGPVRQTGMVDGEPTAEEQESLALQMASQESGPGWSGCCEKLILGPFVPKWKDQWVQILPGRLIVYRVAKKPHPWHDKPQLILMIMHDWTEIHEWPQEEALKYRRKHVLGVRSQGKDGFTREISLSFKHLSKMRKMAELLEEIKQVDPDANHTKKMTMWRAAMNGDMLGVEVGLVKGSINDRNAHSSTMLHCCVTGYRVAKETGDPAKMDLLAYTAGKLLELGADPQLLDNQGRSCLRMADGTKLFALMATAITKNAKGDAGRAEAERLKTARPGKLAKPTKPLQGGWGSPWVGGWVGWVGGWVAGRVCLRWPAPAALACTCTLHLHLLPTPAELYSALRTTPPIVLRTLHPSLSYPRLSLTGLLSVAALSPRTPHTPSAVRSLHTRSLHTRCTAHAAAGAELAKQAKRKAAEAKAERRKALATKKVRRVRRSEGTKVRR
jgi:hypothetical protein